jgi:hypothetical protein
MYRMYGTRTMQEQLSTEPYQHTRLSFVRETRTKLKFRIRRATRYRGMRTFATPSFAGIAYMDVGKGRELGAEA